ncbi:MAG: hypothetical protein ACFFAO_02090 [Candidatus Hermodarchaeota archaeon]
MENTETDEFNEKILQAFANKAQRFEQKVIELEQNLKVKETELEYLAKLFDKEKSLATLDLENEKKKMSILEKKLKESEKLNIEKDEQINQLKSQVEELTTQISNKDGEFGTIDSKINEILKKVSTNEEGIEEKSEIDGDLQKKIDDLDEIVSQKEAKIKEQKEELIKREEGIKNQIEQIQALQAELSEFKPPDITSITKDRLVCAKCGAVGKDIKTVEDKSKPLSYMGNIPMYAKIRICKKCGYEF